MDDRAEFEAAVKALGDKWDISLPRAMSCGIEQDGYSYGLAQFGYLIWQAATARQRERDAQIVENAPLGYITEGEHEVVEKFADTVVEAIRRQP